MKGDGEILEEIVSKERHKEINKVGYHRIYSKTKDVVILHVQYVEKRELSWYMYVHPIGVSVTYVVLWLTKLTGQSWYFR